MSDNVIFSYSRKQALSDGVLVDVTDLAREAGFLWPTVVSGNLYAIYLSPTTALFAEGQSLAGRLWDVLTVLRYAIRNSPLEAYLRFTVLFALTPGLAPVPVDLVSVAGPDDDGDPCLTIMLPGDE